VGPVEPPTLAIEISLLPQLPPAVALARLTLAPTHTLPTPVIAAGTAFTVTVMLALQPEGGHVKVTTPGDTAEATPLALMVATAALLLVHEPATVLVYAAVLPAQILVGPVIGPGVALTVTLTVATQPVGGANVIVATPALTPLTTPPAVTPAIAVLLLVHVPIEGVAVSIVELLVHTILAPVIVGAVFTVIAFVVLHPPTE